MNVSRSEELALAIDGRPSPAGMDGELMGALQTVAQVRQALAGMVAPSAFKAQLLASLMLLHPGSLRWWERLWRRLPGVPSSKLGSALPPSAQGQIWTNQRKVQTAAAAVVVVGLGLGWALRQRWAASRGPLLDRP